MKVDKIASIIAFIFIAVIVLSFAGFLIGAMFEWDTFADISLKVLAVSWAIFLCVLVLDSAYLSIFQ